VELLTTRDGGRIPQSHLSEMRRTHTNIPGNWAIQVEDGPRTSGAHAAGQAGRQGSAGRAQRQSCTRRQQGRVRWEFRDEPNRETWLDCAPKTSEVVVADSSSPKARRKPPPVLRIWTEAAQVYLSKRCQQSTGRRVYPSTTKHMKLIVPR